MPESSLATSVAGVTAFLHDAIGVRSADVPRLLSRRADVMMATSICIYRVLRPPEGGWGCLNSVGSMRTHKGSAEESIFFDISAIFAWSTYQHIVNI